MGSKKNLFGNCSWIYLPDVTFTIAEFTFFRKKKIYLFGKDQLIAANQMGKHSDMSVKLLSFQNILSL